MRFSIVALLATAIALAAVNPLMLIPLAISVVSNIAGGALGNRLGNIFFPETELDYQISPQSEFDIAKSHGLFNPGILSPTLSLITLGLCVNCNAKPASSAFLHENPSEDGQHIAHLAYCEECFPLFRNRSNSLCWCQQSSKVLMPPSSLRASNLPLCEGCIPLGEFRIFKLI